jgi:transcriptional regulator GlxA family with amidase domain
LKIAFIIFDGITWLDLVGVYDPLTRLRTQGFLPDLEWDICSMQPFAADYTGLQVAATFTGNSLAAYDVLFVPGGYGTRNLLNDPSFISWIRTAAGARYKISVCTGSLILGAAGFLLDKKATTHFREYDALRPFCRQVLMERIVDEEDVITAGAVTSSLDLGLHLCRKWAGEAAEDSIRKSLDYEGRTFSPGSPERT